MSVLACDRDGCENIMCDRHSYRYGYICDDCFVELVRLGPGVAIQAFMEGLVAETFDVDASLAYFDEVFQS